MGLLASNRHSGRCYSLRYRVVHSQAESTTNLRGGQDCADRDGTHRLGTAWLLLLLLQGELCQRRRVLAQLPHARRRRRPH